MSASGCVHHSRRDAVTVCSSCGAGICQECAHPTPIGFKCPACSGARRTGTAGRRRTLLRGAGIGVGVVAVTLVAVVLWPTGTAGPVSDAAVGLPEPVTFTADDGTTLHGVVDLPAIPGTHAGVLVVGGYGATTAVGIGPNGGAADPLYRDVGTTLTAAGLAVLRYDKRWTGDGAPDGPPLTYDDRVADARAALTALRAREDVDPDRLAVVGHGEGALVALQLARDDAGVAALALMNPWGRPLGDVLATEFTRGLEGEDRRVHEDLARTLRETVTGLIATGTVADRDDLPEVLRTVFPETLDAYNQGLFAIDPARLGAGVRVPTLLAHGSMDPCVRADEDIGRLLAVMEGPADVEVLTREDAGHTFLLGEAAGLATEHPDDGMARDDHDERDQGALDEIARWIASTLGASATG